MSSQKALYLLGVNDRFEVRVKSIPEPGPGEVLVEVHAAGLNPVDWKVRAQGIIVKTYPAILGLDGAGVVKRLGAGVTNFEVGDRIAFHGSFGERAVFQQYTVADADVAVKISQNLTFDEAATLPVAVETAAFGLYNRKGSGGIELAAPWIVDGRGKYAGEPILVVGGASAVGQQAIQFAKLSGFGPIITTGSVHNSAFLKSLGATHVLDRNSPLSELSRSIAAITSAPLKVAYDAISSPETQNAAYAALAPGGQLVHVLFDKIDDSIRTPDKYSTLAHGNSHAPEQREIARSLYANLTRLLEAGDIKPNNVQVLPDGLAGIPDGLETLKQGVSAVKLVAHPQETV
ncbi:zinc-binding alcohol dehydrogenase family protein [Phanerochaete sordida]|uniref:Zinc-binding alcohol dehydrogenase family protein n=1 Tax=Phanerochaete sordida TaxID=48140 RepID=A0A9P3LDF0_9APHY|nr:zinc-binding alcohol dehydrogenase family protein [Phanerochaete sordida]